MWSRAGSAFVPSSRTVSPFTVPSPASINSSACRREASPAAAINFCRRSSMVQRLEVRGRRSEVSEDCLLSLTSDLRPLTSVLSFAAAREVFKVLDVRQLAQVAEAELHQELFRGSVHHRAAHGLLAAIGDDEALVQERLDGG